MSDDDLAFKALADPTRRFLLDLLFAREGRTLGELESEVEMTRFGVAKHLRVLEDAGLVVSRRSGREKLHFLNPVPIKLIHDRWIGKFTERPAGALADLKRELESDMTTTETAESKTVQVYRVYIKAAPEAIWEAITKPEWTVKFGYQAPVEYDLRPGGAFRGLASDVMKEHGAPDVLIDGEVIESDPPRRLVQTWRALFLDEPFTRLTYEIEDDGAGVSRLTVTHDVTDAPKTALQTAGDAPGAGGGWSQTLSDLKTLLETGEALYT
ncbi:metalloregulator ArsR/SmtB family transcription factor [Actinomadura syzygii]|uniref:Metalloregulator ArsR/SmtB family transcription factor n=1 Tax=Actinomadura syzygii TaxID=1427538 RepID=A0A5D0TRN4_9ACTN|nr:metalloregulator ArsR/SmtB family transcription factor [Actinomadura syzygii]TYC07982.1 metalloregulator ArsR/SmtB family transcription factor [Actinomadura syzygii]